MLRTIIIDDESRGREVLHKMLQKFCGNVEVVALADSAGAGKKLIREHRPDLVFLDIEMPHENGFEMLEHLGAIDFNVVFVSAHERHAIKAMMVGFHILEQIREETPTDERAIFGYRIVETEVRACVNADLRQPGFGLE